ncbi:hypothetical protein K4K49_011438 [Colletotrichum sp. SAR 10_70]|nr:hypothetical protein K4K50_011287 [Colletotrichum sp. SAR 10_71]KAI8192731.1 hypothetical protein K4K49_011438 [Colletotrichum sp. SAR 10_70]KAJ4998907.1 hypothetical protein K4K48_004834 [Colletotrichum sp. SAR 10_66]
MDHRIVQDPRIQQPFAVSLKRQVDFPNGFSLPKFTRACVYFSRLAGRNPNDLIPIHPVIQRRFSIDLNDVIAQPVVYVPADALEIGVRFRRSFHPGIREFDQMRDKDDYVRLYVFKLNHSADTQYGPAEAFADFYPDGPPIRFWVRKDAGEYMLPKF